MLERLDSIEARYEELEGLLGDPQVFGDPEAYQKVAKEHKRLSSIVQKYREYKGVMKEIEDARAMLEDETDGEFREMLEDELKSLRSREASLRDELRRALLPRDPNDEKNVIVEIRAGTGGEEAALFAADLYRMYTRYAERHGWRTEVMSTSPTDLGGFKEIIFVVEGEGAYSRLKFESGVHRVQRIPVTESGGRIHTSTATVAVLPEAEEVDVQIDPNDLRIDTFCSSGPGGQSVNTTYSAVRITHLPTGLVVSCQDEKSQHKNRERALRVLRARLLDMAKQAQQQEVAEARRAQVGMAERSERIRTYNFPQSRVSDHRIGLTLYRIHEILDGDLDEIIDALAADEQARLLEQAQ